MPRVQRPITQDLASSTRVATFWTAAPTPRTPLVPPHTSFRAPSASRAKETWQGGVPPPEAVRYALDDAAAPRGPREPGLAAAGVHRRSCAEGLPMTAGRTIPRSSLIMSELAPDPFEQRRRSLEEAFFKQRDQQLLARLRAELEALERREQLARVSGIQDTKVLDDLVRAGVAAETLVALRLVPLVEVAWADGMVAQAERTAILNAAAAIDVHPGSPAYELLDRWLTERPDEQLVKAWKEYVRELAKSLPADSVAAMRRETIDRCQQVAAAAGGFLGLASISAAEQARIDEFARAWEG